MPNSRHFYSASAVGVGAVLTSPALEESWAASCLPIIGGRSTSPIAGPVAWPTAADPVLQFQLAQTEVTGRETAAPPKAPPAPPGTRYYRTTMRKTVTRLNLLNRVIASIDVTLTFVYESHLLVVNRHLDKLVVVDVDSNTPPAAEPFANVAIPGVALPAPITLTAGIYQQAGLDFKAFRAAGVDALRPLPKHLKHGQGELAGHKQGVFFTALAETGGAVFGTYVSPDFGRVDLPVLPGDAGSVGSVYFGEWHGEPYHQSFTLLRVVLNNAQDALSRQTAFTGEIVIDGDENGRTVP